MAVSDVKKNRANPNIYRSGGKTYVALSGRDNQGVQFRQLKPGEGKGFIRTDTGENYKPDLSTEHGGFGVSFLSKAKSAVTKAVKVNVAGAVGVVSGFATGGVKGAIVGGVTSGTNAAIALSKGKKVSNSRLLKESAGFGAGSGLATGLLSSFPLAPSTPGSGGFSLSKAIANTGKNKFGVVGSVFNSVGNFAKAGVPAFASIFNHGAVPGSAETAPEVLESNDHLYDKVRTGYSKIRDSIPGAANLPDAQTATDYIRDKAVGSAKNRVARFFGRTNNGAATGEPVVVNNIPGGGEPMNPGVVLAGLGVLALLYVSKK